MTEVYLDLDRTLFNTDLFSELSWQFLAETYHVSTDEESRQESFFVHSNNMYYYDFAEHVRSTGLDADQVYEAIRQSELADGRLEYSGTGELIKGLGNRARILTYGADDYQRLKVDLCPSITGVPVVTTQRPKRLFFQDNPTPAVLFDDKPIGDELPSSVTFVQSTSYNDISAPEESVSWHIVESIDEFREFIEPLDLLQKS